MRAEAASRESTSILGGCHCGGLHVEFCTTLAPADIHPRACDCSFCQKHNAAYVSDPAGTLSILENADGALGEYRQGSKTAQFVFCRFCGVLVAVLFEQESQIFGAVNYRCLNSSVRFGDAVSASPQKLDVGEKVSRWSQLWIADVKVTKFANNSKR